MSVYLVCEGCLPYVWLRSHLFHLFIHLTRKYCFSILVFFQLISCKFNMLVGPSNIQCWTLQWKAKSRRVLIKMLGSAEGSNENGLLIWWRSSCASILDFASHFFLPLFGTIVSTHRRRGSYRSSKSWNAVWHSTHPITWIGVISCLAVLNLSSQLMITIMNWYTLFGFKVV